MMDRVEKAGLGIAIAGHAVLFGLLSVGFLATPNPANLKQKPIEVTLTDEVALESTAPDPISEPPAALSPEPAPLDMPEPEAQPAPPEPEPMKRAEVKPAPAPKPAEKKPTEKPKPEKAAAKPAPKAPSKQQATAEPQRKSRLSRDMLAGLTDAPTQTRATGTPAQKAGPAVQSALAAEVLRQLKPHWTAPTGADAEKLQTKLCLTVSKTGAVTNIETQGTTGVTASNRGLVQLHQERAIKAVKLASPFKNLPPQFYDTWKSMCPIGFDKRLSQ
ncbi:cell envelope biogenesis protein TolA [Sphingomonas sp. LaA6.9]|uniref:cell envelope biogenesis protein TolA n=1 Tax=Sphingomonas sp. LaA6.9 TaxID=2919914 RepID=UPI0032AEE236